MQADPDWDGHSWPEDCALDLSAALVTPWSPRLLLSPCKQHGRPARGYLNKWGNEDLAVLPLSCLVLQRQFFDSNMSTCWQQVCV